MQQSNLGGYQQNEEPQQSQINPLIQALGITGVGAGGGFLIDSELRRRKSGGDKSFKDAATESRDDFVTALRVLTGRSDYDLRGKPDSPKPNIRGNVPDDAEFRSISHFAESAPESSLYSLKNSNNHFTQMAIAARDAYQPSSEDFLSTVRDYRTSRGQSAEGPRSSVAFQRIPVLDAIRDLGAEGRIPGVGYDADEMQFRRQNNIALMKGNAAQAVGSAAGRTASDFINNGARSLWWLINAPQAVSDLFSEEVAGRANRYGLYGQDIMSYDEAERLNLLNRDGSPANNSINIISDKTDDPYLLDKIKQARTAVRRTPGFDEKVDQHRLQMFGRKRTGNNLSTLLALPSAIAINAGLGLTNPFGGSDGYKAVLPSEEDPMKTRNVIGEIASKYILGRKGDILPWEEFKKVRPDVTKDEYMRYKGYKYDKGVDLNFLDGDWNLGGILKGTDDGIEGGEVMFLGKHMATDTVLMPTIAAALGAAGGVALGRGGYLNAEGIHEGNERRAARRSQIEAQYAPGDTKTDKDKKLLAQIDRQDKRAKWRQSLLDGIPSQGREEGADVTSMRDYLDKSGPLPKSGNRRTEMIGNFRDRLRRMNPITSGLIGGAAALSAATLMGHENERRRREQKVQENLRKQEPFNGIDAGL